MDKLTLSVCMIVKDEEQVLARCLACVRPFADEIVIVDTGSSDKTVQIAESFTSRIYRYDWNDDFAAARNFSFSKATCDLVMWLDADDVITPPNAQKIIALKGQMRDYDLAFLRYCTAFEEGKPTFVYLRERIFKREKHYVWQGFVHEVIVPSGKVTYADIDIEHRKGKVGDSFRNLHLYQKHIAAGESLDERQKYYYARELFYHKLYEESIARFLEFLRGDGWTQNKAEACIFLCRAYLSLGRETEGMEQLSRAFVYAPPNAEACCMFGDYWSSRDVHLAIYWYERALCLPPDERQGGFCNLDYSGFIPYVQLCVLYDRLGEHRKAWEYNEQAGACKPHNAIYLANKNYFEHLRKE